MTKSPMLRASSSFESKMSAIITRVAPVIVIFIAIVIAIVIVLCYCAVIAFFVYRASKIRFAFCPVHALLFVRFSWRLASFGLINVFVNFHLVRRMHLPIICTLCALYKQKNVSKRDWPCNIGDDNDVLNGFNVFCLPIAFAH